MESKVEMNKELLDLFDERIKQYGLGASQVSQRPQEKSWILYCLGAVNEKLDKTSLGRRMDNLPVPATFSKILLTGIDFGCGEEVLAMVAMMVAGGRFFKRPNTPEERAVADQKMARFLQPGSDHLTLLAVYNAWKEKKGSKEWCFDNSIYFKHLQKAEYWRKNIAWAIKRMDMKIVGGRIDNPKIRKALTAGMFTKSAWWDPDENCYRTLEEKSKKVHIHEESVLFGKAPPAFVIYGYIDKKKGSMILVTEIEREWLLELGGKYFRAVSPRRTAATG